MITLTVAATTKYVLRNKKRQKYKKLNTFPLSCINSSLVLPSSSIKIVHKRHNSFKRNRDVDISRQKETQTPIFQQIIKWT